LFGFPKGAVDSSDKSILDTAIRELKEECSIDLKTGTARILPSAIVHNRPRIHERHTYIIAYFDDPPLITLSEELAEYRWYLSIPHKSLMTRPARDIMRIIFRNGLVSLPESP
jgi:8-oxo-dGTP pyrophosphatase MutT (NUDIX family)